MEIRYSGHSAYRTEYHIVWIPKYRRRVLNPGVQGYLRKLFPKVMGKLPCCEIVEYSIQRDHLHVVMIIPPRYAVCEVTGKLKGITASRITFLWLDKVYRKENAFWSPGYFVSTVGIDEDKILKYISWQQTQDLGQAKLEFFKSTMAFAVRIYGKFI